MAITPKLDLRQAQSLVMTPQLQQAIKLLQLTNIELAAYVEDELMRNPLLEQGEEQPERSISEEAFGNGDNDAAVGGDLSDLDQSQLALDRLSGNEQTDLTGQSGPLDADMGEVYNSDTGSDAAVDVVGGDMGVSDFYGGSGSGAYYDGDSDFGVEQTAGEGVSLRDHLREQLHVEISDPVERMVGAELIEQLDDAGYLTEMPTDLAGRLGIEEAMVENLLKRLQAFDPPGLFARDLAECLKLQLRDKDRYDPAMAVLVENLDLLAQHDIPRLMSLCGVDAEDMRDMISELKELNPKPGLAFDYGVAQAVAPDVFVRENPDGGWRVELNTATLPRVLINNRYFSEISSHAKSKDEKNYLSECMTNANWLVKSLDQRARTILKVSSEIVKQQDGFLAHGVAHLKPLNLRAIADAIEMHESTVSRVTSNKFMSTPRGVFELKYFFTSAISGGEGEDSHSSEAVRHKIKDLIDAESPKAILSDDKLVELLKDANIVIARRTIAKYREAMGIPSSVQRRRMKKMQMS